MNDNIIESYNIITSRQNPSVIFACNLLDKKHRQKENKFRFDGIKLFREAMISGVEIETAFVMKSKSEKIFSIIGDFLTNATVGGFDIKVVEDGVFEKISEEKSPEGIVCVAKNIDKFHKIGKIKYEYLESILRSDARIFALESLRDPGNLGTIIRSSVAFGVDCLFVSSDCAEIYNPKTIRATMGTIFRQKIIAVDDLADVIKLSSKFDRKTYAATLSDNAFLLGKTELSNRDCIVIGNEGHGLSDSVMNACDESILIPMTPNAESLNAAIASSICMWEQFGRNL